MIFFIKTNIISFAQKTLTIAAKKSPPALICSRDRHISPPATRGAIAPARNI
jgi:hypothetical protein